MIGRTCDRKISYLEHPNPHPRFVDGERKVLFNSDWSGRSQIYLVDAEQWLSRWQDRAPFTRRPGRFYQSQSNLPDPRDGPPV